MGEEKITQSNSTIELTRYTIFKMFSNIISISSNGDNDPIDITDKISQVVTESELDRGILIIFVFGSTSAIETIETTGY